jgi:hypothetical protein
MGLMRLEGGAAKGLLNRRRDRRVVSQILEAGFNAHRDECLGFDDED